MMKRISYVAMCLIITVTPCWGTIYDYSVEGTFLDPNQVSGSILGSVWLDDNGSAPSLDNIKGEFRYNIPYFNLIFLNPDMNFVKTGTGLHFRIQFWTAGTANAGYRNFNDSFILVADSGDIFQSAGIYTNTGNFIDDFASIPTQLFIPGGWTQFSTPDTGLWLRSMSITLTQVGVVPEPSTLMLLGFGLMGIVCMGRMLKN